MIKMPGYLLQPCKSEAAFEAIPQQNNDNLRVDLDACQAALENIGYHEVCNARVLIIMKKELEVTIYPSGKMILKTDSQDSAKRVMDEIYDVILNDQF